MSIGSANSLFNNQKNIVKQKYLVVDDEMNEDDKEDFILDLEVDENLALFASSYEEALKIIKLHSDIAIFFLDSKIPKSNQQLNNEEPNILNNPNEWGISLIPEINKVYQNTTIIIYSAYVTKTYLQKRAKELKFNNIKGFYGKPGGVKHRKKLYQDAIRIYSPTQRKKNPTLVDQGIFDYSVLDENISSYVYEKTATIKQLAKRMAEDTVNVGKALTEVKNVLEHDQYLRWLETEVGLSYYQANRFVNVAKSFEASEVKNLPISSTVLFVLGPSSVPQSARDEALDRAKQGEKISVKLAEEIKDKHIAKDNTPQTTSTVAHKGLIEPHTTVNPDTKPPEIIKVIRQQNLWQLGKHLLFCGDPNDPEFIKHLPSKISLGLAFPTTKNWFFSPQISGVLSRAGAAFSYFTSYKHDTEQVKLSYKAIQNLVEINTDDGDNIAICFVPDPAILLMAHQMGCCCYLIESDRHKCERIRAVWDKFEKSN